MHTSSSFLAISRAHWHRKARALSVLAFSVAVLYGSAHWPIWMAVAGA